MHGYENGNMSQPFVAAARWRRLAVWRIRRSSQKKISGSSVSGGGSESNAASAGWRHRQYWHLLAASG